MSTQEVQMRAVRKFKPLGARLLVKPIRTTLSIEEQYRQVGLIPVVEQHNEAPVTKGIVIALGDDPFIRENVHVGDTVHFGRHSGHDCVLEGEDFRMLEYHEVTAVECEHDVKPPAGEAVM